jgi:hypothetical protein
MMSSNPPISPIEQEELEEAPLDVIVFQQSRKKEPPKASGVHSD